MDGKVKTNLLKGDSVMAKKVLRRLLALTFALAMMCSVTAGAVSGSMPPVSTERRIINREVAPGVVLLEEGYRMEAGLYTFYKTYTVRLRGTQSTFIMEDRNTAHLDGVWIKLEDDSSGGGAPVEFNIDEYSRSGSGVRRHTHKVTLVEGAEAATQLDDPVNCTYSIYAKFTSSEENGTIKVTISCNAYESMY